MNRLLARVYLAAIGSYAVGYSTLFIILSGLYAGGTSYVPGYLLTTALLGALAYTRFLIGERREESGDKQLVFLALGIVLLIAATILTVFVQPPEHILYPVLTMLIPGLLMWVRMMEAVDDQSYLRHAMHHHYRQEIAMIVFATGLTLILQGDPRWQTQMLPFFSAFLFLRMLALTWASQWMRGIDSTASGMNRIQNNLPLFVVGGALFGAWLLNAVGVPVFKSVWSAIGNVLYPLFLAVGWLLSWLGLSDFHGRASKSEGEGELTELPEVDGNLEGAIDPLIVENTIMIVMLLAVLVVLILYLRQRGRMQRGKAKGRIVEVREFIRDTAAKKAKRGGGIPAASLTRMRQLYRRFLYAMKKDGYERHSGETALAYIRRVAVHRPELAAPMRELTDIYMDERYGERSVADREPLAARLTDELTQKRPR